MKQINTVKHQPCSFLQIWLAPTKPRLFSITYNKKVFLEPQPIVPLVVQHDGHLIQPPVNSSSASCQQHWEESVSNIQSVISILMTNSTLYGNNKFMFIVNFKRLVWPWYHTNEPSSIILNIKPTCKVKRRCTDNCLLFLIVFRSLIFKWKTAYLKNDVTFDRKHNSHICWSSCLCFKIENQLHSTVNSKNNYWQYYSNRWNWYNTGWVFQVISRITFPTKI